MIRLSGNSVNDGQNNKGITINYSGLRPGEKLFEELLLNNNPEETIHPKIKKGLEKSFDMKEIEKLKDSLILYKEKNNIDEAKKLISIYVDGFTKN